MRAACLGPTSARVPRGYGSASTEASRLGFLGRLCGGTVAATVWGAAFDAIDFVRREEQTDKRVPTAETAVEMLATLGS